MIYLLLFILGLCVGSFLNVVIYRETVDEGIIKVKKRKKTKKRYFKYSKYLPDWIIGRSYCDHCQKPIPWHDNIPLLSFVLLAGKCRFCKKKIPFQYPLVEFLTGVEFIWIYFLVQGNLRFFSRFEGFYSLLSLVVWLILGACFLAIFIADLKYQIIPDSAVFFGILVSFFKLLIDYRYTGMIDLSVLLAAFGASLFFLGLVLVTKGKGMGIGDIKLAFLMGMILGVPKILIALFFSFLTGALVGVILILLGKKGLKSKIAFGPFLIAGTIFALFLGEKILRIFF